MDTVNDRIVSASHAIEETYEAGARVLKLLPIFVPRRFGSAGKRLKLHPDDYFAFGTSRGSIKD